MRRATLEKEIQQQIEVALGAEPDLLLLRNAVGGARMMNEDTGKPYTWKFGLGEGSPDLVGLLRRWVYIPQKVEALHGATTIGTWFCLEVKVPGEEAEPHQAKVHEIWRRFGAFVAVVHSVEEARAALEQARHAR